MKKDGLIPFLRRGKMKSSRITKITVLMLLMPMMLWANNGIAQKQISLSVKNASLEEVLREVRRLSGHYILYNLEDVRGIKDVSLNVEKVSVLDILDIALKNSGLSYDFEDDTILITVSKASAQQPSQNRTITGSVFDEEGRPLPGATVMIEGTSSGTVTDADGKFSLRFSSGIPRPVMVVSFVGMVKQTVTIDQRSEYKVTLKPDRHTMDDVVITGLYTRSKESFTGSSVTFSRTEIQSIGNQNVLQSLKTLDPSFSIIESNEFGSDPNRLPDIEIRGKTSVIGLSEEYGTDPNQPLFILDGFESTLRAISDLNMDMVESITILKDAAATAIYGSKSANGVVVVYTRRPEVGQLKVNYKGDFSVSFPDLSDYNLMNAKEKLEFERLSLAWGSIDEEGNIISEANANDYMRVYKEVERGVNTYWLHLPVRTAFTGRHNLFVEGGTPEIRYGISVNYGDTKGVMKGSDRETVGGTFRLMYIKNNISFNNILSIDNVTANRENVEFSRFAKMSPYYRKYTDDGYTPVTYVRRSYNSDYLTNNPLWDMYLNSFDKTTNFGFTNNLEIEWKVLEELRVRGRFGIGKTAEKQTIFKSPFHTSFIGSSQEETGSYFQSNGDLFHYVGDITISYAKLFNDIHRLFAVGGSGFRQDNESHANYTVTGFIDEDYPNPNFALGYRPNTQPFYSESKRREAGYYLNTGYSYMDRYLLDANYRIDGTSIFGSSKRFAHTWSVGLSWNVHNEDFFYSSNVLNNLKIRGSIGNPGNQNFSDYISIMVYEYNLSNPNVFGPGMTIGNFGNNNLDWQKTIDRNIGFDLTMFNNDLKVSFDYFHKNTDPLLVYVGTPPSTGITKIPKNLGRQITEGLTASVIYQIIGTEDITWSANVKLRSIKSRYEDIGDQLNQYNLANYGKSLLRYYDGGSPNDLWAVPSLGIDPATGREILVKKDGSRTFLYDYADEVVVGNTEPKAEGTFGMYFRYKRLSAGFNIRYRLGGQAYMSALYDKVEAVTDRFVNMDRRALYDRWKNPGDQAKYKAIWIVESLAQYRMSSRFVMDNNILAGESINVSYRTDGDWLRYIGASSLTFSAYMNDIFRFSTIRNERGIQYPFARSVSFSLGLSF